MTEPADKSEFLLLIQGANRQKLLSLVEERLGLLSERDAVQVLRHPYLTEQVVSLLMSVRKLRTFRAVKKLVGLSPVSPRLEALNCLEDLGWRDLLDISREARTPMPVRLAASERILGKLIKLAAGERTTLARLADRPVIGALLRDAESRVFRAVLKNPRLVPDDLVAWVSTGRPNPLHLQILAADTRWAVMGEIRRALVECRLIPRSVALGLLSRCSRGDLRSLAENPRIDPLIRACAENLGGTGADGD